MLPEAARACIERYPLSFVATINEDGSPNLSPKGAIRVWDADRLVFADIASPGTVANIRRDPRVEVNVVDHFGRRGWRFRGTAEITRKPAVLEALRGEYPDEPYPFEQAVLITVEQASELVSPSYALGKTEPELRAEMLERGDSSLVAPGPLGVRAGAVCVACERARPVLVCPVGCRHCLECAGRGGGRCTRCGGELAPL